MVLHFQRVYATTIEMCKGRHTTASLAFCHRQLFIHSIFSYQWTTTSITVCSVYLPPSQKWDIKDLEDLYRQLPTPALVLGDFNAHSQTWGCRDTNARGRCIEDFMLKQNVCILNTGNSTYFHLGTGSLSALISACVTHHYT